MSTLAYTTAVGRRKTATARVWIKRGTGKITINGKDQEVYLFRNVFLSLNSMMMNSAGSSRFSAACTFPSPQPSAPASTVSFSELPSGTVKFIV